MKILITGIAGLIGSNLARFIQQETEHTVVGIDDLSCGLKSNIPRGVPWYNISLDGSERSNEIFKFEKPDVVYHFAAYAAECLSPFIRCFNYQNNVVATAEVVNNCLRNRVQRLVFTSSIAAYGNGTPPFNEDDACVPMDPYGVAKLACEHDIRIAGEQHGLDWCVLRPHNVYGPGQVCTQKYRNVFGIWMWRYMNGDPLLVYGDGTQQRAFSYIDDMLVPMYQAGVVVGASKQAINLGGGNPISINTAASLLSLIMGGGGHPIDHREGRHEVAQAWCTTEKSRRILGYQDITPLEDGLQRMWDWVRVTKQSVAPSPRIEVAEGVPPYWVQD